MAAAAFVAPKDVSTRPSRAWTATVALAAAVLVGCGSGNGNAEDRIDGYLRDQYPQRQWKASCSTAAEGRICSVYFVASLDEPLRNVVADAIAAADEGARHRELVDDPVFELAVYPVVVTPNGVLGMALACSQQHGPNPPLLAFSGAYGAGASEREAAVDAFAADAGSQKCRPVAGTVPVDVELPR